ncbi:hypothetical protein J4E93_006347 [Alternaria ventricosa]|uniref:uncharacterized protein n=1 Tax=Alternaria ventricosa TaxID=1187951 RepID=UPI0020C2DAE0|nr:uncharacterized protein J4E93_006347 [Alternaria ventricosa]KAI4644444.1 hypothetical protein J4E93_006347 [Alternaria ventricosa]
MEKLPNELLIKVASDLDRESLRSLALVSKKMEPVARDLLWRAVRVPDRTLPNEPSGIAALAHILVQNPSLGKLVRSLELHPEDRMVTVEPSLMSPQGPFMPHSSLGQVNECALVGFILEQTSELEVLKLEVLAEKQSYRHEYDYERYTDAISPFEMIFGPQSSSYPEGLAKLKELHFNAQAFEWSWCELPSLKVLHIGRGCRLLEDTKVPDNLTSSIDTLIWDMCTSQFESEDPEKTDDFLSRFSSLRELEIMLSNVIVKQADRDSPHEHRAVVKDNQWMYDDPLDKPLYHFVTEQLSSLTDTLESLALRISEKGCEDRWYVGQLDHADYSSFTKLRRLELPHWLLTGPSEERPMAEVGDILPSTLEELIITRLDEGEDSIWNITDGIILARRHHGGFPELRKVTLDEVGKPIVYAWAGGPISRLQELSIEVDAWVLDWSSDAFWESLSSSEWHRYKVWLSSEPRHLHLPPGREPGLSSFD